MWTVNLVLAPAGIIGVLIFGRAALWVILVCIAVACLTEAAFQKALKREGTITDGSAFMTGLLLAYCLPSTCPLWLAGLGSFFAIVVGKQAFGGIGRNLFNPALAGRAFLMVLAPKYFVIFPKPLVYDVVAQATPLTLLKEGRVNTLVNTGLNYWDLFFGNRGGCIGEVCIALLLAGGIFLLLKKIITWHIPLSFMATAAVVAWAFGGRDGLFTGDPLFHLLSGGLILGAFFMATDYVTSPVTKKGQIVFGIGCGFFTAAIRLWGGYPEGVCYAILIMNAFVPLINRTTKTRIPL